MESLPSNLIFLIATNLSVGSILSFALTCSSYMWLIDDNLLFKCLYERDFGKYIKKKKRNKKKLYPEWSSEMKLVYKILEYMRRDICTAMVEGKQSYHIVAEIIHPEFFDDDLSSLFDHFVGIPLINSNKTLGYDTRFELYTIEHMNLNYRIIRCNREYKNFDDVPLDHNFSSKVTVLKEGLCYWCNRRKKYYLIYPLKAIEKLVRDYSAKQDLRAFQRLNIFGLGH